MRNAEWNASIQHSVFSIQHFPSLLLFWTVRLLGAAVQVLRAGAGADLAEAGEVLGLDLRRRAVLPADGVVHFLAVDADFLRGVDPQAHLVAPDVHDGDLDVVTDHDRL